MRVRLEQHVEVPGAGEVVVEPGREERAGRVGRAADRPLRARADQQPLPVRGRLGVVRHVDAHQSVGRPQVLLGAVEVGAAVGEVALEALRGVVVRPRRHVVRLALEHDGGLGERRTPAPLLGDPRISGAGERPVPEVGADVDPVLVDPPDHALGLGQREAVLDERARLEVELPHDGRVRPTPGQLDERPPVARPQRRRTLPDPVLVLGLAERVDVEQQLPLGLALPVRLE